MERMGTFFKYLIWFLLTFAIVSFLAWNLLDYADKPVKETNTTNEQQI